MGICKSLFILIIIAIILFIGAFKESERIIIKEHSIEIISVIRNRFDILYKRAKGIKVPEKELDGFFE